MRAAIDRSQWALIQDKDMDLAAPTVPAHAPALGARWLRWLDEVGLADVALVGGRIAGRDG
jgi:hypothetical protein